MPSPGGLHRHGCSRSRTPEDELGQLLGLSALSDRTRLEVFVASADVDGGKLDPEARCPGPPGETLSLVADTRSARTAYAGRRFRSRCSAARPQCGDGTGARSHEGIEHDVILIGVELDQAHRQLDGEGSRVADSGRALRWDLPEVGGGFEELVSRDRRRRRQPGRCRLSALSARSKRPLLAMTIRSVTSRSTGLLGRWNVPHAHEPPAARPFHQTTSPRSSSPRSWRISVTSPPSDRYGRRPRLATLTAMRPPGSSTRLHSSKTSRSRVRYSK